MTPAIPALRTTQKVPDRAYAFKPQLLPATDGVEGFGRQLGSTTAVYQEDEQTVRATGLFIKNRLPQSVLFMVAGGNAPGQVALLKPLMSTLLDAGVKVMAAWQGIQTLVEQHPDIRNLGMDDIDGLALLSGSVFIGTSRMPQTKKDPSLIDQMVANIKASGAEKIVILGGDGTLSLAKEFVKRDVPVVGIPKTMDGNLAVLSNGKLDRVYSLGFLTAVERTSQYAKKLDAWAKANKQVVIFEVNGRNTGWLTFESAKRAGLPFIVNEGRPTENELIRMASELGSSGGVILVAESVELLDARGVEVPLAVINQNKIDKGVASQVQEAAASIWPNVRSCELGLLVKAGDADDLQLYLYEMALSAKNQDRVNVVSVPAENLENLSFRLPDNTYVVRSETDLDTLKSALQKTTKPYLIIVSENHQFSDPVEPSAVQYDAAGRILLSSRLIGKNIAQYLRDRGFNTSSFVGTHLLMAAATSVFDAHQADIMADAALAALAFGSGADAVTFVEGFQTAQLLPLDSLRDVEMPQAVLMAEDQAEIDDLNKVLIYLAKNMSELFEFDPQTQTDPDHKTISEYLEFIPSLLRRASFVENAIDIINSQALDFINRIFRYIEDKQSEFVDGLKANINLSNDKWMAEYTRSVAPLLRINKKLKEMTKDVATFLRPDKLSSFCAVVHAINNYWAGILSYSSFINEEMVPSVKQVVLSGRFDKPGNLIGLFNQTMAAMTDKAGGGTIKLFHNDLSRLFNIREEVLKDLSVIVTELIGNAVKYAKPNEKPHVELNSSLQNDRLVIEVLDRGIGMSQDFIGSRFGRAGEREDRGGSTVTHGLNSGLGIFGIKELLAKWGGSLSVVSTVHEKTVIKIELPQNQIELIGEPEINIQASNDEAIMPDLWSAIGEQAADLAYMPALPGFGVGVPLSVVLPR